MAKKLTQKQRKHREHLRRSKTPLPFDTCPVPPILHAVLRDGRDHKVSFGVISADRRDGIAQRFGHESELQAWEAAQNGTGLPANPPKTSTHEYRNGGTNPKYPGVSGTPAFSDVKVGATLPPFRLGLDLQSNEQASEFCRDMAALGYEFFQPYRTGTELHHVCCKVNPLPNLIARGRVE